MNTKIGILGGMGPQASVELYRLLIVKSVSDYRAINNDDFPHIVIDSVPVPDFISSSVQMIMARDMLIGAVRRLNRLGVGQIGIACNTAHILLPDLQAVSNKPIVSIMDEVACVISQKRMQRVGLLASQMTYKARLYQGSLTKITTVIVPDDEMRMSLDKLIRNIVSGKSVLVLERQAINLVTSFVEQYKLDGLLLGCTELPLVLKSKLSVPMISSLAVLADTLLTGYYSKESEFI